MVRSSLSLGRWVGVELRVHLSFPVLLLACVAYGAVAANNPIRGLGIFAALVLAVVVREGTRLLTAAYAGMNVRAHVLLPIGGVLALSAPGGSEPSLRAMTFLAPAANVFAGLLLLGASWAVAPGVQMFASPWISAAHVLRSFVWMQFLMAAVNLLPATLVPAERFVRARGKAASAETRAAAVPAPSAARSFGPASGAALAMLAVGVITMNVWLIAFACLLLLLTQIQTGQAGGAGAVPPGNSVQVRDVMLTDFAVLSSSDTLQGAMDRSLRSMQEVFPVVRGDRLVGGVLRQNIAEHLQAEGDGYLQGMMNRKLEIASPDEPLLAALRRASANQGSEFIPVAENGRLCGILTPQTLGLAVVRVQRANRAASAEQQ